MSAQLTIAILTHFSKWPSPSAVIPCKEAMILPLSSVGLCFTSTLREGVGVLADMLGVEAVRERLGGVETVSRTWIHRG